MITIVGPECGLVARSIAERASQLHTRHVAGVVSAVFDETAESWLLRTYSGDEVRSPVVIDARRLHVSTQPTYPGRGEFSGPSFHWSEWPRVFDPRGKRIAVIGDRAAHVVAALPGADLTLFDCPPNWRTTKTRRWFRRPRSGQPILKRSNVERITRAGIRTTDGVDHDADAIIFATGSITSPGLLDDALVGSHGVTLQQVWKDGAASYFGIAVHGFPNHFMLNGPDSPPSPRSAERQLDYVIECLLRMRQIGATRIEVRRSAQQQFTQRAGTTRPSKAFDFSTGEAPHEIYDGPATLTICGDDHPVRVRLTGHLDPIDGKYHWQGTVFAASAELPSRPVELAIDDLSAQARITEQTPSGGYSIAGVGAPPFDIR